MRGDFTRFTHNPRKHYTGVLKQQGRVDLDADWNEQVAIQEHLDRVTNIDVIGRCGVPIHGGGFAIGLVGDGQDLDLSISPGRIYVDGILCELEPGEDPQDITTFHHQPDYSPVASEWPDDMGSGYRDLVYLDVWQRHITALEDPAIREVALGGPDTATRLKTVWQVKVLHKVDDSVSCDTPVEGWAPAPSTGRLTAHVPPTPPETDPCIPAPGGGYQGLENRLYRVEIHDGGGLGTATFKWSRDNGSVVFAIEQFHERQGPSPSVQVKSLGKDQVLALHGGDWVEIIDEETELRGEPGVLLQIRPDGVNEAERILTLTGDLTDVATGTGAKVRRWDMPSEEIPTTDSPYPLEDGIEVTFSGDTFSTGDYWVFAARAATGEVEPLPDAPPRGIEHHYCALAFVTWSATGGGTAVVPSIENCPHLFPPLTELPGGGCEFTICVPPGNDDDATALQDAIDAVIARGGGEVCLEAGVYDLKRGLTMRGPAVPYPALCLRLRGRGSSTMLVHSIADGSPALSVEDAAEFTVQDLTILHPESRGSPAVAISNGRDFTLERVSIATDCEQEAPSDPLHGCCLVLSDCEAGTIERCALVSRVPGDPARPRGCAVSLSNVSVLRFRENWVSADTGLWAYEDDRPESASNLYAIQIAGNFMECADRDGISLGSNRRVEPRSRLYIGSILVADNHIAAGRHGVVVYGEGSVDIIGNVIWVRGSSDTSGRLAGIQVGATDGRIAWNDVTPAEGGEDIAIDGIVLDQVWEEVSATPPGSYHVIGNRVAGVSGNGIAIAGHINSALIKQNAVDDVGGTGIIVSSTGWADHLSVESNEVRNVAPAPLEASQGDWKPERQASGICLYNAERAEVAGNLVDGVGQGPKEGTHRCVGVQLAAVGSARVSGNQVAAIGPNEFDGEVIGISVLHDALESFVDLTCNLVGQGMASAGGVAVPGGWSALRVGPLPSGTFTPRIYNALLGLRARRASPRAMVAPPATAPLAGLTADFDYYQQPYTMTVEFYDRSYAGPDSFIETWDWQFGDGSGSSDPNPTHTYAAPDSYLVVLAVTNKGSQTDVVRRVVDVRSELPPGGVHADFSASRTSGPAPLTVAFTDTSTGSPPTAWQWTFGDGGTSTAQHPNHTYATPGQYTVSLTVTSAENTDTATKERYITVGGPEHTVIVRGNLLEAPGPNEAVNIDADNCVFSDNRCAVPPGPSLPSPPAHPRVAVAIGKAGQPLNYTVLGNSTVGQIRVKDEELSAPWSALNSIVV